MGDRDKVNPLLTRRGFVGLAGKGAMAIALGGSLRFLGRENDFIRPPGALPEEEFLSICIRCDECIDACPYGLISAVPIIESVINAGTPRLALYCSRCSRCRDACPVSALRGRR